uniref:Predicted protein n=1 Tax=Hordeum vulgare subsp. vulgare TaxID=112509 RepID=F2DDJ9_HORVV|nr:predicted protein [Hordeum vulgare subsp. vulgare]
MNILLTSILSTNFHLSAQPISFSYSRHRLRKHLGIKNRR